MLVCKEASSGARKNSGCLTFVFIASLHMKLGNRNEKCVIFDNLWMWFIVSLYCWRKECPDLRGHKGQMLTFLWWFWWLFFLSEKELQNDVRDEEKFIGDESWEQTQEGDVGALYLEQLALKTNCQERLDHTNFRFLLWRALAKFPERVEPRSRELSPLFLRFIK